jgi:predicted oxidoreductase
MINSKNFHEKVISGSAFVWSQKGYKVASFTVTYWGDKTEEPYSMNRGFEYLANIRQITDKGIHWYVFVLAKKASGFIPFSQLTETTKS